MTKKDHILIAQALHAARPHPRDPGAEIKIEAWTACVAALIKCLTWDNPHFDAEGFLIACERGQQAPARRA